MEDAILMVILGTAVLNYFPRMLPMVFLSRARVPEILSEWLGFIPAAVLAALVAPEIFMAESHISLSLGNKALLAALPTFLAAVLTKSLAVTLVTGVAAAAALYHFMGI